MYRKETLYLQKFTTAHFLYNPSGFYFLMKNIWKFKIEFIGSQSSPILIVAYKYAVL